MAIFNSNQLLHHSMKYKSMLRNVFGIGLLVLFCACAPKEKGSSEPQTAKAPTEKKVAPQPAPSDNLLAQDKKLVQQAVEQLFEVCRDNDFSQAADLLVYRGDNAERKWKSAYRWENEDEQLAVSSQCAKIQVMLTDLDSYDFKEFFKENESEGEWNIWVVDMNYSDGSTEEMSFAYLRVKNNFLLGDID